MSSRHLLLVLGILAYAGSALAQEFPDTPAGGAVDRGLPGVVLRLYDIGQEMRALPDVVAGQLPNVAKVIPTIDLDGARNDFAPLRDEFVSDVVGTLSVKLPGLYTFRLISDDGSQLWIDGELVIDNDGLHGADPKDGQIELATFHLYGLHVRHFDATYDERLTLQWKAPGTDEFVVVPASALTHDASESVETAAGQKRIIPPLRRGRPGDGTPITGKANPACLYAVGSPVIHDLPLSVMLHNGQLRPMTHAVGQGDHPVVGWLPAEEPGTRYDWVAKEPVSPYPGQLIVGNVGDRESKRVFLDKTDAREQGCVFRYGLAFPIAPTSTEKRTFEMLAVRAMSNGLEITFTKPLDSRVGWDPDSYYIEQWPFDTDKGIAPSRDGVRYPVKSASVAPDGTHVFLEIDNLKPSHVVYLRLLPPCLSADGELPWSTEAWYTLSVIPTDRFGQVLTPPAQEPQNVLTPEEAAAGWKLLFDGKTTAGWRGYQKDHFPDGWVVKDGCLVRVGPGGDIITDQQFGNFELKLDWRISAGGNSGIFYRVKEDVGWPFETGPEMQVLDNAEHPDGRKPETSAGSNYGLYAPVRDVTQPVGLFNHVRIVAQGNHIEHWLNGVKVVEYELGSKDWQERVANSKFKQWPQYGRIAKGHIVLQDHGDEVWYRNIKIRELPAE